MIDVTVTFKYTPRVGPVERAILSLPNKLRNLSTVMQEQVAPLFNAMESKHFATKGAAFGLPWAPWQPATLRKRTRKGNASKGLLTDTDNLLDTLLAERPDDQRLDATTGGTFHLTFDTRVPYAIFLQKGTKFMVPRQVIPEPLPDSFKRAVRVVLKGYLIDSSVANAG